MRGKGDSKIMTTYKDPAQKFKNINQADPSNYDESHETNTATCNIGFRILI